MLASPIIYLLSGMGSTVDLWPEPKRFHFQRPQPGLSDWERLTQDTNRVGQHLWAAIGQMNSELEANGQKAREDPASKRIE